MRILTILVSVFFTAFILFFTQGMAEAKIPTKLKVTYHQLSPEAKEQVDCLAHNIYFEAATEPAEGQIAVAFVTYHRMKSGKYPNTYCGVVKQRLGEVCQFSWWCDAKANYRSTKKLLTTESNSLYNDVLNRAVHFYVHHDTMKDPSKGALFYHADYVNPGWSNMRTTAVVGRHIFYNRVKHKEI